MQRCEIMKAAIRQAFDAVNAANDEQAGKSQSAAGEQATGEQEDVLKVFIAPEFYFQGAQSGYPAKYAEDLFKSMQQETDQECYRNWLFVMGTFVAYRDLFDRQADQVDIFNFSLIHKGGPHLPVPVDAWTGLKSIAVVKIYVSKVDYQLMDTPTESSEQIEIGGSVKQLNLEDGDIVEMTVGEQTFSLQKWFAKPGGEWCIGGQEGGSHFKIDNIVFGIEVCLDHSMARMATYQLKYAADGEPCVQVHLIPSAGMTIQKYARAANLICNVDKGHSVMEIGNLEAVVSGATDTDQLRSKVSKNSSLRSALKVVPITEPGVKSFSTFFDPTRLLEAPVGTDASLCVVAAQAQSSQLLANYGYIVVYSPETVPPAWYANRIIPPK